MVEPQTDPVIQIGTYVQFVGF
jgi:DNA polymerase delta subunit 1